MIERSSLGRIGVWTAVQQWPTDRGAVAAAAAEIEELGFRAMWMAGVTGHLPLAETILDSTTSLVVATGIIPVYFLPAADAAAGHHRLTTAHPGRFILGLGTGHAHSVESHGMVYGRPYSKLVEYLDALDDAVDPVPQGERILAALGPKALRLAGERTLGAHPSNVSTQHTALARETMGPSALLVPSQKVLISTDPTEARAVARAAVDMYLTMPNYLNSFRRLGFADEDFVDGGSDRLVDTLVAWGSPAEVMRRLDEHLDAGADHVVVRVLSNRTGLEALPLDEWRAAAQFLVR